jgi:hypothetical protein
LSLSSFDSHFTPHHPTLTFALSKQGLLDPNPLEKRYYMVASLLLLPTRHRHRHRHRLQVCLSPTPPLGLTTPVHRQSSQSFKRPTSIPLLLLSYISSVSKPSVAIVKAPHHGRELQQRFVLFQNPTPLRRRNVRQRVFADSFLPSTGAARPKLNYTPEERSLFGRLFRECDTDGTNVVTGEAAVRMFQRSRISEQVLSEVCSLL